MNRKTARVFKNFIFVSFRTNQVLNYLRGLVNFVDFKQNICFTKLYLKLLPELHQGIVSVSFKT
ncbi:hypothetical protein BST97_11355 [Nonlabens spongiae]|uniref:Uncharacterized protein n=1 Tax=Nonlabens spongiae TaxID=331648 RepID=A0A1W6MLN9_9FLAO|nr:hypothetical protein BST97_11355 [Nonlabens spongiae]